MKLENVLSGLNAGEVLILTAVAQGEAAYSPSREAWEALIMTMESAASSSDPSRWLACLAFATGFINQSQMFTERTLN